MATLTWEALGGDPAPGDAGAVDRLAERFSSIADDAADARRRLDRFRQGVDDSIWRGESARAFKDEIGKLPPRLGKLHQSYATAAEGMAAYARSLRALQDEARTALAQARGAERDAEAHERSRDLVQAADPGGPTIVHDEAIAAARARLAATGDRVDAIRGRRRAAESAAIAKLEQAQDQGIPNDPPWKRVWNAIDKWVDDHADILKKISGVLKAVAAVAGVISLIPGLGVVFGPIALLAAGSALLLDATLAATGNGSWKTLLVDAALMALPGAGRLLATAVKGRRAVHLADGSVELSLRYKRGWTAAQKSAADGKVAALNKAKLVVTKPPQRSGTSASTRYRQAGGTVPHKHDVDHVVDLQLGGADNVKNMKPLDLSVNRSLGAQIQHQIKPLPNKTPVSKVSIQERPTGTPVGVGTGDRS
ncbi:MAG TPA: hypothetical protein VF045_02170 [Acidimicrobiales bacterium]